MKKLERKYISVIKVQKAFARSINFYQENSISQDQLTRETSIATISQHFIWFYGEIEEYLKYFFAKKQPKSRNILKALHNKHLLTPVDRDIFLKIIHLRKTLIQSKDDIESAIPNIMEYTPTLQKLTHIIATLHSTVHPE